MKKYLIAASVLALTAASGANAADIIRPQPTTPVYTAPVFSWTGFYAGAQIGWAWSDTDLSADNALMTKRSFSPDPDGFIGGIYLGYNFDFGNNFVAGIETDFAWSNIDETSSVATALGGRMDAKVKQEWEGATRIRLGYSADRFLPYIAGGVAYAKVKSSVNSKDSFGVNVLPSRSGSDTFVGWTVGAGVDYAVTDNLLLRLEYRYTDFGSEDFGGADTLRVNTDYKTNDVRVGVAYKF